MKWGLGKYDEIRNDPELCFLTKFAHAATETPPGAPLQEGTVLNSPTTSTPLDSPKPVLNSTDSTSNSIPDSIPTPILDLTTKSQPDSTPKSQHDSAPKPMEVAEQPLNIDQIANSSTIDSSNSATAPSTDSIPTIEQPTSTEIKEEKENDQKSAMPMWPSSKQLTARVKRLHRVMQQNERNHEKEEKQKKKQIEKAEKEEAKEKKKAALAAEWSKREKQDFYRTLNTFGVPPDELGAPDWNKIREKANLKRKSVEAVSKFYEEFLSQCKQILQDRKSQAEDEVKEEIKEHQEGEKEGKEEEHPAADATYHQCKRIVQRLALFEEMRSILLTMDRKDLDLLLGCSIF